jgi:hypothetical protein
MTPRVPSSPELTRTGDLFEIPAPDGRRGYGQVVVEGRVLYIVVFADLYSEVVDLDEVIKSDVFLVGWTVDALIFHGRWKVAGNRPPVVDRVPFPSYKVTVNGRVYAHDFNGENYRLATARDAEILDNKTTIAPIVFQKAFLAHHSFGDWSRTYDQLTVQYAHRRVIRDERG